MATKKQEKKKITDKKITVKKPVIKKKTSAVKPVSSKKSSPVRGVTKIKSSPVTPANKLTLTGELPKEWNPVILVATFICCLAGWVEMSTAAAVFKKAAFLGIPFVVANPVTVALVNLTSPELRGSAIWFFLLWLFSALWFFALTAFFFTIINRFHHSRVFAACCVYILIVIGVAFLG